MPESGSPFDFGRYGEPGEPNPHVARSPFSEPTQDRTSGFWSTADQAPAAVSVGRPPLLWVALGLATAVVGTVVAAVWGRMLPLALLGWLFAGPTAIGLLALFTARDTAQRARPVYASPTWVSLAYWASLAVALLGLLLAAYHIADVVAR
ncbi:MAG: hypothetical protein ACLGIA_11495 [Actinomycetes bacterium]